eukprot:scaffold110423_cov55-Attheya_sp.AAC.2
MSRSVVVFLLSAVLMQVWIGASCAAVETTNTVVTEAQVTVDGDTSYGYTKTPVPAVRQYEDESSSDDPSDDSSADSADDDWERSEETVTQLKNGSICEDRDENCDRLALELAYHPLPMTHRDGFVLTIEREKQLHCKKKTTTIVKILIAHVVGWLVWVDVTQKLLSWQNSVP